MSKQDHFLIHVIILMLKTYKLPMIFNLLKKYKITPLKKKDWQLFIFFAICDVNEI